MCKKRTFFDRGLSGDCVGKHKVAGFFAPAAMLAAVLITTCANPVSGILTLVTGVKLNVTRLSLEVGATETLIATVTPDNARNKAVEWASRNTAVATVEDGAVTAVAAGTVTVMVTTADGGWTAHCTVVVTNPGGDKVAVSGVSLNTKTLTLVKGGTATLIASIAPARAANKNRSWSSSDPSVATVANGAVTAVAVGIAAITVTTEDGGFTSSCVVTVTEPRDDTTPVSGVSLNKTSLALDVGATETLTATVTPANATNRALNWVSGDPSVARVASGTVTAVAAGTTTIIVTTMDGGKTAVCTVTVTAPGGGGGENPGIGAIPVIGVSLNKTSLTLAVGATETLTAMVAPANATNQAVNWTSTNTGVATVANGAVTAVTVGTVIIIVSTVESGKTAFCTVTVTAPGSGAGPEIGAVPVIGVSLNKTSLTLNVGATETLTAAVALANATNQAVNWTSTNTGVATVANGAVTAVAPGTVIIIVSTVEGGKIAFCTVTVTAPGGGEGPGGGTEPGGGAVPVIGVSLNKTSLTLVVGGATETLTATVAPANATNKTITWTSNNTAVATVANGTVTAVGPGAATITVTTADGNRTATCAVTVNNPTVSVIGVSLNKTSLTLEVGATETLTATVAPANATNKAVAWTSSNTAVATVANGTVTAVGPGATTITVTTADGNRAATCAVEVDALMVSLSGGTIAGNIAYAYDTKDASFFNPESDDASSWSWLLSQRPYTYIEGVFVEGRTVTLSPFSIAKYETTYELWRQVKQWADNHGYSFANPGREGHDGIIGAEPTEAKTEPVTMISWRDAIVWCNAYSEMSGKQPVYYTNTSYTTALKTSTNDGGTNTVADKAVMKPGANGYRLPTEAEWEYAARGGGTPSTSGSFAYLWAGTNSATDLKNYAWFGPDERYTRGGDGEIFSNSGDATHPVGQKTANTAGLYDMSGNVFEWCWDWHNESFGTGQVTNPTGVASGEYRVIRGGCWGNQPNGCMVISRLNRCPFDSLNYVGFRVVCRP